MELKTKDLILRFPKIEDIHELEAFITRNENHLAPWESKIEIPLAKLLSNWIQDMEEKRSVRFFLFHKDHPEHLIGMINFTQIFRGAFQACYLGYKIDHAFQGKGHMFNALKTGIEYMFEKEQIHRIMSNFLPRNKRSCALLLRLGFSVEGYAKKYLKINNVWEDHILTSLSAEREANSLDQTIENLKKWEKTL